MGQQEGEAARTFTLILLGLAAPVLLCQLLVIGFGYLAETVVQNLGSSMMVSPTVLAAQHTYAIWTSTISLVLTLGLVALCAMVAITRYRRQLTSLPYALGIYAALGGMLLFTVIAIILRPVSYP